MKIILTKLANKLSCLCTNYLFSFQKHSINQLNKIIFGKKSTIYFKNRQFSNKYFILFKFDFFEGNFQNFKNLMKKVKFDVLEILFLEVGFYCRCCFILIIDIFFSILQQISQIILQALANQTSSLFLSKINFLKNFLIH